MYTDNIKLFAIIKQKKTKQNKKNKQKNPPEKMETDTDNMNILPGCRSGIWYKWAMLIMKSGRR